jgi:lipopolysaccharide/colanic/teichoic acid biosynthesis glycosyltransferase
MHRFVLLSIDLLLVVIATVAALALRENLEVAPQKFFDLLPYLVMTLGVSVPILVLAGLNRTLWRFSSFEDYLRVVGAAVTIVVLAVGVGFAFNRLEGVARSLPILQAVLMACTLIGVRIAMRLRHLRRARGPHAPPVWTTTQKQEAVLVVGLNAVTELFLQSVQEFAGEQVKVAGLLGRGERHRRRLLRLHPVLGLPEEIDRILADLEVRGVMIQRIVVTTKFDGLSPAAREALLRIERTSDITLDFFGERVLLNHRGRLEPGDSLGGRNAARRATQALEAEFAALASRPYFRCKRALDVTLATALLVCLAPITLVLGIILSMSIAAPPLFWQQRPGWMGRPFRLFKFSTMGPAHDEHGNRLSDAERTSGIGRLVRRTRLDELPQLYNILTGEMSFVGPRPLLPADQPLGSELRLALRPGLTGWAQIKGGRELSASDKAALDIWYVRHASLAVDLKILAGTVSTLLFGEAVDRDAILMARQELTSRQAEIELFAA